MAIIEFDLKGKICPFVVMHIIKKISTMEIGDVFKFQVCDPLAIKSIPEELEDYVDLNVEIETINSGWTIIIARY